MDYCIWMEEIYLPLTDGYGRFTLILIGAYEVDTVSVTATIQTLNIWVDLGLRYVYELPHLEKRKVSL